jgi:hypothetical protein
VFPSDFERIEVLKDAGSEVIYSAAAPDAEATLE